MENFSNDEYQLMIETINAELYNISVKQNQELAYATQRRLEQRTRLLRNLQRRIMENMNHMDFTSSLVVGSND